MCAAGNSSNNLAQNTQPPALDAEGFLVNLNDWNEAAAKFLASQDQLELTPAHLEIIQLVRQFYQDFGLSPAMRPLVNYLKMHLSADKTTSIYLMQLFGQSPAKNLARLSGLPKPDNCL